MHLQGDELFAPGAGAGASAGAEVLLVPVPVGAGAVTLVKFYTVPKMLYLKFSTIIQRQWILTCHYQMIPCIMFYLI